MHAIFKEYSQQLGRVESSISKMSTTPSCVYIYIYKTYLHDAFKDRLGQSEPFDIPPHLLNLIKPHSGLAHLEEPFTHAEIDAIIKDLPSNKSPGPDGFNTDFIKRC